MTDSTPQSRRKLQALWDTYCTAKMRALSSNADVYDKIEYDIALGELAAELKKAFSGSPLNRSIYDSYMNRVRH